ncbi:MAG: hypothetical protein O2990_09175, partial [Bacteroidetes bacterium]|nr:hypothetical protein [Bacteroidota bacterium]
KLVRRGNLQRLVFRRMGLAGDVVWLRKEPKVGNSRVERGQGTGKKSQRRIQIFSSSKTENR